MKKTAKPPRELLRKGHAHKSKKDYKRLRSSDEWADHFDGMGKLKIINKNGSLE